MKHYLVISTKVLEKSLNSESKKLMKQVYGKDVNKIYYRIKTKTELDNPRRLFIKGDGKILEVEIEPHISLVHNIELEKVEDFILKAKEICKKYRHMNLEYAGIGNYDMDFTFFVKFICPFELISLRLELLNLSKPYMSEAEYEQHTSVNYIPHATILYDDIDPKKVLAAYKLFDINKFTQTLEVNEFILWKVSLESQEIVARLPLG